MTTALITGASAGIGAEFARQLAAAGDALILVARDATRLEDLAAQLRSTHQVRVEVLPADLSVRKQLQQVADRVADRDRPVDLLVNNAGFGVSAGLGRSALADEERALDVMCRAVLVLSKTAIEPMTARRYGRIINVSSVAGFAPMGTYSAAKAWVTSFTETLADDLRGTGVSATALCPGFTHTEFHQRAAMDVSQLPQRLWLDAERLVRECLADAERGRVLSVPGPIYKGTVALLDVLPRGLVRAALRRMPRGISMESSRPGRS